MDPAEKKRKLIISGALIATLIAVVLVENEETAMDVVETIQPTRSSNDRARSQEDKMEHLDISQLGQRKFNSLAGELFASTTWTPRQPQVNLEEQIANKIAQAAKTPPPPPPAPTAPPLQFNYIGKAIAEDGTWVFLSRAGENLIAKIGGKITDQYRLDSVNDDAITLTYLPLNIKQTLTIQNKIAGNSR